jgi:hypothetical protein
MMATTTRSSIRVKALWFIIQPYQYSNMLSR